MGFFQSTMIGLSIFGADSCNGVFSNNEVHIGMEHEFKHVKLMTFPADTIAKHKIEARRVGEKDYSKGISSFQHTASAIDVGMNGVPVLDQGEDGTCVTFASTAALDALTGIDISQQCSLSLDLYMGNSYWDGAFYPSEIIDPLKKYGVVERYACPYMYPDPSQTIDPMQYVQFAHPEASEVVRSMQYSYYKSPNLDVVKSSLRGGHRVLMAFYLDSTHQQAVQGFDVTINGFKKMGGLYACKQQRSPDYCVQSNAGHEVLIIGFDDQQELLKIRNSWGPYFGDGGNYYMTYTFFKQMGVDLTVVY